LPDLHSFPTRRSSDLILAQPRVSRGETAAEPPDFKEVYELIREHLPGMSQAQLDRTAVTALVKALSPKVKLVSGEPEASSSGPRSEEHTSELQSRFDL